MGVRPAMMYGLETVELAKRQEVEMEVAYSWRCYTIFIRGDKNGQDQHRWDGLERKHERQD